MKIQIRDFQALHSVDLEVSGLTVITGPSNIGKTALMRAIEGAIWGKPGDHFIRHGETTTKVRIKDEGADPLDLYWTKTNRPTKDVQNSLKVNGTLHTKLGRDHPTLTQGLGFAELTTSASRFRPQIAKQHDTPFLLMESETTVAEVLRLLSRGDVTARASELVKSDRRREELTIRTRKDDLLAAQASRDELDNLPIITQKVKDLHQLKATLDGVERKNQALIADLDRLQELQPRTVPANPPEVTVPPQLILLEDLIRLEELEPRAVPANPPEFTIPTQALQALEDLQALRRLDADVAGIIYEQEDLKLKLTNLEEAKKQLEEEMGTCPTCERPFDGHQH